MTATQQSGDFVIIKINRKNGQVTITDENGNPPPKMEDLEPGAPVRVGETVQYIDGVFWYSVNPFCAVHGGRRVCFP